MSDIRRDIDKFYKKNYSDQQIPLEDGNPIWSMLGWGYKLFKWSILLALFVGLTASSQCYEQVKEICQ